MPQQPDGALKQLRQRHKDQVLDLLRREGSLTRADLAARTGLSRSTLYDIIAELAISGVVVTSRSDGPGPRGRGRPVEFLTLNPGAGQAIGIDFARRYIHVAIANMAHVIVGTASERHAADLPWQRRLEIAQGLIGDLTEGGVRLGALTAIGVGVVGPVSSPGAEGVGARRLQAVPELLRSKFDVPVLMDNNTTLAALAESIWGAAKNEKDVVYLRLSHGVGGGLVLGGSLYRGVHGISGEFGHIAVDVDGKRCVCGARGCLGTVASIRAVLDACHTRDLNRVLAALADGDPLVTEVFERVGTQVGLALSTACNIVGPGLVVIGGELAAAGEALTKPIERMLRAHVMPFARRHVEVRLATIGETAGALGGVALALHESPLLSRYPPAPGSPDVAPGSPDVALGSPDVVLGSPDVAVMGDGDHGRSRRRSRR